MHFTQHLLISAAAGLALYRADRRRVALLTLAGVGLDVDHYVLYARRSGDWNPLGALRYNTWRAQKPGPGKPHQPFGPLRSLFHRPTLTLPLAWLFARRWPALRPVALGVTLHLALDTPWDRLLDWRVWQRSGVRCEACGVRDRSLRVYHLLRPAWGGKPWALDNRIVWCATCERGQRKREFPDS